MPFPILPNSGTSVAKAVSEREHLTQRWKRCSTQNQVFPRPVGRLKPRLRFVAFMARLEAAPFQGLLWFLEFTNRHPSARFACSGQAKNRTRALPDPAGSRSLCATPLPWDDSEGQNQRQNQSQKRRTGVSDPHNQSQSQKATSTAEGGAPLTSGSDTMRGCCRLKLPELRRWRRRVCSGGRR